MDRHPFAIRKLHTGDFVLITSWDADSVTVAPLLADKEAYQIAGRYLDCGEGVRAALDYTAIVTPNIVGEKVADVPVTAPVKIGRAAPESFQPIADRMQLLSYVSSEEDAARVLRADAARVS